MRIGLISDTHALLRREALDALRGCDRIVHAGDIGDASILEALAAVAPLVAVRGNNDRGDWADGLPLTAVLEAGGVRIGVVHELRHADAFEATPLDVLVYGHSHRPVVETVGTRLHVNPGSAGPRRFRLPVSLAELAIRGGRVDALLIPLTVSPPTPR